MAPIPVTHSSLFQMDENLYYDHMETVEKLSNAVIEGSNAEVVIV